MAAIRSPFASVLLLALLGLSGPRVFAEAPLVDHPVQWYADDQRPIPMPTERDPNLMWDMVNDSVVLPLERTLRPGRIVRRIGTLFGGDHVPPAANINALDEVPNSSWFTNRIGFYVLSPEAVACGSCPEGGPAQGAPWTIVSAKSEGVTPGFVIRDARGDHWLIKFDPPGCLGVTTGAGVISNRILHAAGYNVPADVIVRFTHDDLRLGEGVKVKLPDGSKRSMTSADLGAIFGSVAKLSDGRFHAIASRYVPGRPLGPFDYRGRRADDPNDRIDHQQRRELRGLRMFAAWLNHFDMKQHNTLDAYIGEEGRGFVRHYLIDFASTLGAGANGPAQRFGYEYTLDIVPILGRVLALGLHDDPWRQLTRDHGLAEVCFFESEIFEPLKFKPLQPNSAFADMTPCDGYWAAKIISAFTDEQLLAICKQAHYRNPEATRYTAGMLSERRDKIARRLFDRVPPLDFFRLEKDRIEYHDLGVERGIYPAGETRYRARHAWVTAEREADALSEWHVSRVTGIPLPEPPEAAAPFLMVEFQIDRGAGWSATTRIFIARTSARIIALER